MSDPKPPDDRHPGVAGPDERIETPAIGPPTRDTERRQSPAVLSPAARVMDPTGSRNRPITVVIAASHLLNNNITRELRDDPGIEVVGLATTVREAETAVREHMPRVALVGVELGRDAAGVVALCELLREEMPTVAVVAVSDSDRSDDLFACVRAGAISCFYGRASPMTLRRTIVGAHRRESVLSPGVAQAILADYQRMEADEQTLLAPAPTLTATEEEVLQRLAAGESPTSIAERHVVTMRMIGMHAGYAVTKIHRTYHDDAQFRALR